MASTCKFCGSLISGGVRNLSKSKRWIRILTPRACLKSLMSTSAEADAPGSLSSPEKSEKDSLEAAPAHYRHVFPEFLPDPNAKKRNKLSETLERQDMLRRRAIIEIPEFYVGSVLAVTVSDPNAPGCESRFVGICIQRSGHGLRADFTLRNVIDDQGVEIRYDLYNPTLQKIEVLKLEKRLDDELFYLRDAPLEYSTFDFNMKAELHPAGASVPVNPLKVKLREKPWLERWERKELKGVQDLGLPEKYYTRAAQLAEPWEKYDLMKQYRKTIPLEEQEEIFQEVHKEQVQIDKQRQERRRQQKHKS